MAKSGKATVVYAISCMLIVGNIAFACWYCSEGRAWKYVDKSDPQAVKLYLDSAKENASRQTAMQHLLPLLETKYESFDFRDDAIGTKLKVFLHKYPEFDASRVEEDLFARSGGNIDMGRVYLELFPHGQKSETVKHRIDELGSKIDERNWRPIANSLDEARLQKFARKAQTAKYKKIAEERIAALYSDYEYVKGKDTYEAYRRYLNANPNGLYATEARKRMLVAAKRERRRLSDQDFAPFLQSAPRSGLCPSQSGHRCPPHAYCRSRCSQYPCAEWPRRIRSDLFPKS